MDSNRFIEIVRQLYIVLFFGWSSLYSQQIAGELLGVIYLNIDPQEMKDYRVTGVKATTNIYMTTGNNLSFKKPVTKLECIFLINDSGFVYATQYWKKKKDTTTVVTHKEVLPNLSIPFSIWDSTFIDSPFVYRYNKHDKQIVGKYDFKGNPFYETSYSSDKYGQKQDSERTYHFTDNRLDSISCIDYYMEAKYTIHFLYYEDGSIEDVYIIEKYKNTSTVSHVYTYKYGDKGLLKSVWLTYPHNPTMDHFTTFEWYFN